MAIHHVVRQAERNTQLAHLVFEQFTQRLQQLQVQCIPGGHRRCDGDLIVVGTLLGLGTGRLDNVRVDRSLSQPFCGGQLIFADSALENLDKLLADDLCASASGSATPASMPMNSISGIDVYDFDAEIFGEGRHDHVRLH